MDHRERLKHILISQALQFNPEGFTLRSGQKSSYLWDLKHVSLQPEVNILLGQLIWEMLKNNPPDSIGGPASGAIPLICATARLAYAEKHPLRAFYIRKEPASPPLDPWIAGNLNPDDEVVGVEDVITTGGAMLEGLKKLGPRNTVSRVVCVIDRLTDPTRLTALGLSVISIFTHHELLADIK